MISAKIILDSISPYGDRLTTMEVVMPRIILAEFNTHRKFSRNSASSRAVSVKKKIEEVRDNPFIPITWGKNQKGMQSTESLNELDANCAREYWNFSRQEAIKQAYHLEELGVHKQFINRLLEPFLWHTVLVSSTEWDNFFIQRCSPLAEPHMEMVANAMKVCLTKSTPILIDSESWHLPFIVWPSTNEYLSNYPSNKESIKVSAARCARVSYQKHGSDSSWEDDLRIGQSLLNANPPHWSPFEHTAKVSRFAKHIKGNFTGWEQARHIEF